MFAQHCILVMEMESGLVAWCGHTGGFGIGVSLTWAGLMIV